MSQVVKQYDYIAYVLINNKASLTTADTGLIYGDELSHSMKVIVEVLELFKGGRSTIIVERGVRTSCDMGLSENSEWILFGTKTKPGYAGVGYCSTVFRMKKANGEREWHYDSGIRSMKTIRELLNLPAKKSPVGLFTSYYPDGSVLAVENYLAGELTGIRKIYYPNGILTSEGFYKNGQPDLLQKNYSTSGQLLSEFKYQDNEIINSVFWYDTSFESRRWSIIFSDIKKIPPARIQKQSEGWFDILKKNRHSFVYYRSGEIEKEHYAFNDEAFKMSCEYFESGNLKFEGHYFKEGDISEEKAWDDSGRLLSDKKWSKGKFLGDAVKK